MSDEERRVLVARNNLYQSGNALSVSLQPEALENLMYEVGDHAILYEDPDGGLVITADSARYQSQGADSYGTRKIRINAHGTIIISIPKPYITDVLGYQNMKDAKGTEVAIYIDPVTQDMHFKFPDEQ